jgi:cation transport regulator ChaB
MWSTIKALAEFLGLLRKLFDWFRDEQQKQIGRNEVAHDVTQETVEAENRMRDVVRPSDDAVADSLRSTKF